MPITLQEISSRALAFSRRRVATFERRAKKIDGKDGYIDLLWKGTLLVEHKSRGKDLDRAYAYLTWRRFKLLPDG